MSVAFTTDRAWDPGQFPAGHTISGLTDTWDRGSLTLTRIPAAGVTSGVVQLEAIPAAGQNFGTSDGTTWVVRVNGTLSAGSASMTIPTNGGIMDIYFSGAPSTGWTGVSLETSSGTQNATYTPNAGDPEYARPRAKILLGCEPVPESIHVYLNGVEQYQPEDWKMMPPDADTATWWIGATPGMEAEANDLLEARYICKPVP